WALTRAAISVERGCHMKRGVTICVCVCAAVLLLTGARGHAQSLGSVLQAQIRMSYALMGLLPAPVIDPTTDPPGRFTNVIPKEFDPGRTNLTQSSWLSGIGCPSNATIALPNADFTGVGGYSSFTDPA